MNFRQISAAGAAVVVSSLALAQSTNPSAAPTAAPTNTPVTTTTTTSTTTAAPPSGASAKSNHYKATVIADEVLVRAAANTDSGYPFGTLSKGVVVTVTDTKPGWVCISTDGPAFANWGGYVQAGSGVVPSADGRKIKITSTTAIHAPNATADFNPDRSFKAIGYLSTGDEVDVIETVKGASDTFYAVALTAKTSGWISDSAVSRNDATTSKTDAAKGSTTTTTTDGATTKSETSTTAEGTESKTTDGKTTDGKTTDGKTTEKRVRRPAPKPVDPAVPTAAQNALNRLDQLETKWTALPKETCSMADLQELQTGFSNLAQDPDAMRGVRNAAMIRSVQVAQLVELRDLKQRAAQVAARGEDKKQQIADLEKWLAARRTYDAVGVLNASVVYDGERLPRLYRLQDPTSGITAAYLTEDPDLKLSSMLGLVVGVKGNKRYDETLRRDVITPTSMTVLQSTNETEIAAPTKVDRAKDGADNTGK